ncbi:MAG: response regulator [Planctomycetota bacterium]
MSILFVDHDPTALLLLEDELSLSDVEWDWEMVGSAEEALERLIQGRFEAVVTALDLPRMSGSELLKHVNARFPDVLRIALTATGHQQSALPAVDSAHQILAKPFRLDVLRGTIDRAICVRDMILSDSLQRVIGGLSSLPSVPSVYQELTQAIRDDESSLQALGAIVSKDAAMTAKVLQIVNSAVFCLGKRVTEPTKAVALLGAETLKSLVLAIGVFQAFESTDSHGLSADKMMHHGMHVAKLTRAICQLEGLEESEREAAVTAATLHDTGKLILNAVDADAYQTVLKLSEQEGAPLWQIERRIFGADHAGAGAALFSIWGLPQRIVEIVALHHDPINAFENTFSSLTAVVAANTLCSEFEDASQGEMMLSHSSLEKNPDLVAYFAGINCCDRVGDWKSLALQQLQLSELAAENQRTAQDT